MSGFDRLSGALQYHIAHTLGWPALRPVQEQAAGAVLDGDNCVVLAPTAGGKTEAAFFPLLSAMDVEDWRPVSVLYLSPIRALLNNQEDRIGYLAGLVERRAFKWHGDVGASARKRFLAGPSDVLLTTPESLEAMMMSARVPVRALFAGLRAVIIDEVHAFAGDDRGAHLAAILERLVRLCGRDVQRIGLSATVGDPEAILAWLTGSSRRPGRVVNPGGAGARAELVIDAVGSIEGAAKVIAALHRGEKRLVFVDSRSKAEQLGGMLAGAGVATFVTHGSLSASERRDAERAFAEQRDCVIVATSALELGIDVGDLDRVLQIDCPATVASFLQRMGRTGRRAGKVANCTFLTTKDAATLQAAALVDLYRAGFVEPVEPSRRALHILAHQLMALAIQSGGTRRGELWGWLSGAAPFGDIAAEEREAIVDHMLAEGLLADHEGKLWLGPEGERHFGRAGFRKLYAVFDAPRLMAVRCDGRDIGSVDTRFLESLFEGTRGRSFVLAGRAWEIVHVDWQRATCAVKPAPAGAAPSWGGGPRHLSYSLCQAMRRVLVSEEVDACWSKRARTRLEALRGEHAFLRDEPTPMVETSRDITWWTFAGGAANLLLARLIEEELGEKATSRNQSITLTGEAAKSAVALRQVLDKLAREGRPTLADARSHTPDRIRLSKFEICLPPALRADFLASATSDLPAARAALGAIQA